MYLQEWIYAESKIKNKKKVETKVTIPVKISHLPFIQWLIGKWATQDLGTILNGQKDCLICFLTEE